MYVCTSITKLCCHFPEHRAAIHTEGDDMSLFKHNMCNMHLILISAVTLPQTMFLVLGVLVLGTYIVHT